jgi:uncharacterized membrane protein
MQRTLSAVLGIIAQLIFTLVIIMKIEDGETNNYKFYLLLVSIVIMVVLFWHNFYKNRNQKEAKVTD